MTTLIRLPSCDEPAFDLFAIAPESMSATDALNMVNTAIETANNEDRDNNYEGCTDGLPVEESLKRRLTLKGFLFVDPLPSAYWDE